MSIRDGAGAMERKKYQGLMALVLTAVLWGTSFPVIKMVVAEVSEYTYTWLRSLIAVIGLTPYVIYKYRVSGIKANAIKGGMLAGGAYALGLWLQGWGTRYTTAGNSAFITGLNTVFVHLYTALILRRYSKQLALSLFLAIIGLYYLTIPSTGFNIGDFLVLLGAFMWALQIVTIDKYAGEDPFILTFFEMTPALLFIIPDITLYGMPRLHIREVMMIAYLALVCGDTAFSLQVYGQRFVNPAAAAIIFLLEPLSAAFFAYIILHEVMNILQIIGATLILISMTIVSLDKSVIK